MDIKSIINLTLEQVKLLYKSPLVIAMLVAVLLSAGLSAFLGMVILGLIFTALYYFVAQNFISTKSAKIDDEADASTQEAIKDDAITSKNKDSLQKDVEGEDNNQAQANA